MCSIFGVFDIKTDAVELRKKALELSRLMRHRGPDWSGIYASDNAILAHELQPPGIARRIWRSLPVPDRV